MTSANSWTNYCRNLILAFLIGASLGGCGTTSVNGPTISDTHSDRDVSSERRKVVWHAEQLIGTPYRYGGSNRKGFDCSGLVQYTHRRVGLKVPRTTASQWKQAQVPDRQNLLPGDLLFFNIGWQKSRHVGIYEGDGLFIHAPSSGKKVSRASLNNPYWRSRLVATKTFL